MPTEPAISDPDPYRGRPPTSHERQAGRPWDDSYRDGPAPWEIGRPQEAVVRAAEAGRIGGTVLDAGCGSGDNALYLAERGLSVFGVDVARTALASARAKAAARNLDIEFAEVDALHLDRLGRTFDTVLDCGLLHTFDADERREYVANVAVVLESGGALHILCFSDEGPDTGPHPLSGTELTSIFGPDTGWHIERVESERIHTRFHDNGASAWFATITRT